MGCLFFFFFSSRRRHTRFDCDWSSDVCSSDLGPPKGEATQRLRANPFDVGVEGESRRGRKDGYDTNLTGRGGSMASRLQYLGVIGQYRKAMEDAITREQVPRDFHDQIRDYFQSLDER